MYIMYAIVINYKPSVLYVWPKKCHYILALVRDIRAVCVRATGVIFSDIFYISVPDLPPTILNELH